MSTQSSSGGLKGWLTWTGQTVYTLSQTTARIVYKWGGKAAFTVATTSMVVLFPLVFEIAREGTVCIH